jgi:hypothetical protein
MSDSHGTTTATTDVDMFGFSTSAFVTCKRCRSKVRISIADAAKVLCNLKNDAHFANDRGTRMPLLARDNTRYIADSELSSEELWTLVTTLAGVSG